MLLLGADFSENLVMKAGTSTGVEVPFCASPLPTMQLLQDGGAPSDRVTCQATPGQVNVALDKVQREDTGPYQLTLENPHGSVNLDLNVTVLGKALVVSDLCR